MRFAKNLADCINHLAPRGLYYSNPKLVFFPITQLLKLYSSFILYMFLGF